MQPNQIIITLLPNPDGDTPLIELHADPELYIGTALWALDTTKKIFARGVVERLGHDTGIVVLPMTPDERDSLNMMTIREIVGDGDNRVLRPSLIDQQAFKGR